MHTKSAAVQLARGRVGDEGVARLARKPLPTRSVTRIASTVPAVWAKAIKGRTSEASA